MAFNPLLDPEKEKKVNDWLTMTRGKGSSFPDVSGSGPQFNTPDLPNASDDGDEWMKLSKNIRSEGPGPNDPGQTSDSNDADNEKVVTSHPGTQPDELAPYLKSQEAQVDKFGPDQEAQVMQHLQEGYKKPGFIASEGLAGLGDAIMQGVARAGPGQALGTIERNKENQMTQVPAEMQKLREGNLQGMKQKMALQQLNPNSTLNNIMKPGLKAGFQAAFPNMTPEQLETISSNPQLAERLMPQLVEAEKAKAENEFKKLNLQLMAKNSEATQALTARERETEAKRAQDESDKAILGGSSVPFVGPSHAQKQAALARLTNPSQQSQQSHGIPDLGSTFNGQKVLKVTKVKGNKD